MSNNDQNRLKGLENMILMGVYMDLNVYLIVGQLDSEPTCAMSENMYI
jgi:hypothetical protein